ncbi:MAG: hypothetical protein J6A16_05195, partial [Oscillospiraceae bacterium]|nr:hypothetical protein [Oscillospiraceae bacterium]
AAAASEEIQDTPVQQEEFTPGSAEYEELKKALTEARIKLALLLAGAAKEKLNEGAKLVELLCLSGMEPEEAAEKVVSEYPNLRLVTRQLPKFAAQTSGTSDGFAAIRSIFSKR